MINFVLAACTLAGAARAEGFGLVDRGSRICSPQTCLERVPLGADGLDLAAQLVRYDADFNDGFEPKRPGVQITYPRLLAVAGATGLSPGSRARLTRDFSELKIKDLAANVAEVVTTTKSDRAPTSTATIEIAFFATVTWADRAAHSGITSLRGRLIVPRDRPLDVNRSFDEINRDLSAMVTIDEVSKDAPSRSQLIEYVAPATMSNLILALLTPAKQLEGSALETVGRWIQSEDASQ